MLNNKKVKARRKHVCTYCRKPIEKGEYYIRINGLFPDVNGKIKWHYYAQHIECNEKFQNHNHNFSFGESFTDLM